MKTGLYEDVSFAVDKTPYLEKILEPVSLKLANMTGKAFVSTMSEPAKDIYLNAALFWAV